MQPDDPNRRDVLALAGAGAVAAAVSPMPKGEPQMERVTGIGGFFFRAKDPKALAEWYEAHLGVTQVPTSYDAEAWQQQAGTTVFAPFKQDTTYFGRPEQMWMINFRVRSLDKMAAQLRGKGIAVEIDPETYPNGRFASVKDPEGNPIQLWEPGGVDKS
jgi:predicted enzyme related to lactoylglutathione lyase